MSARAPARSHRTVVIDDTRDLRELLTIALRHDGFDVVGQAGDGREGIEVVRRERPDVVLLDLAMPELDGVAALPTIRQLVPDAKILVLSGYAAPEMSARALAAGADAYELKSASISRILAHLHGLTRPRVPAPRRQAGASPDPAWELAPFGVLEVAATPAGRVLRSNPAAERLTGAGPGASLADVAPRLAAVVDHHRTDEAAYGVDLPSGPLRVRQRRLGASVLLFLDTEGDDVVLLRRAVATAAHEIRGPVTVLSGVAEMVTRDAEILTEPERQRLLTSVARQARLLDSLTADLLTAAQVQRGALRIDLQTVDPCSVVEGLADRYDARLVVEDPRAVRADPLRLEQMLVNLLGNAVSHGAAPYVVRVRPDGAYVGIDVVDHGPGIPPDLTDQLFREFARSSGARSGGTGLGLYVVHTLAAAQQGSAHYAPGDPTGAVFTIRLPAG